MGSYIIKGWNIFKCILSPHEIKGVLAEFHHVNFQSRVSEDYIESNPDDFLKAYQEFYDKLSSGYIFERKRDEKYVDWHTGITDDLSKCQYGKPFKDEDRGQFYKLNAFSEPCVGISPFALTISNDKKLHSNYSYTQFLPYVVGLQVEYPCLFVKNEEGQIFEFQTETFAVYQKIYERVKRISKGLVFTAYEKKYRSAVNIGNDAYRDFWAFHFSRVHGCTK